MIKELNTALPHTTEYKPPRLNLNIKMHRFSFSVEAVKELGLIKGDKIAFAYDTEDVGIFYFYRSPVGFPLQVVKTRQGSIRLTATNAAASKEIKKHLGLLENRSFKVKKDTAPFNGREAWFITKY